MGCAPPPDRAFSPAAVDARHFGFTLRACLPVVLALAAALSGCATNPVTGSSDFVLMSEDQELAMGRQAAQEVAKAYRVYPDPALQSYVQALGERLAATSHRPQLVYRFTVIDSPEVNAFALPGGYIYLSRGLLAFLNSEAELAGVLGHEIGHVTARHSVRQASAAQAANIGSTLGAIFFPVLRTQAAGGLVNVFGTALLRGYGREQELEADRLGAEYLARVGLPPRAMLSVLSVLKGQEQIDQATATLEGREPRSYHGLFSTHPDNDTRLKEAVLAAGAGGGRTADESPEARQAFIQRLAGLTFGDSAEEGVTRDGVFLHGDLRFALDLPEHWTVSNRPDSIVITAPGGAAAVQLTSVDQNRRVPPREFITGELGLDGLQAEGDISHGDIPGYSAVARVSGQDMRVNVLYLDQRAYIILGAVKDAARIAEFDQQFLRLAKSFRRLGPDEAHRAQALHIVVRAAKPGENFQTLAAASPLGNQAEAYLRLLNGAYPQGEPVPGQLLKLVQ